MDSQNDSIVNSTHEHLKITEGGFLTGRNPFEFNPSTPLPTFIVQLIIIVLMSRIVKFIISPVRQPSVIAETISGIILGPSVFGHIPCYTETIFPKPSMPFLNLMSNFGLVLFLFLVGLELDPKMLKKSLNRSLTISLAGMAFPFALGIGASYALYSYVEPDDYKTSFLKYCLFLGVAMTITAFPVLARILMELDLLKTEVGRITISAAVVDDATSWCLLALVISLINAASGMIALYIFFIGLGYSIFLMFGFRPLYLWILRRSGAFDSEPSQGVMVITLCVVFISAFITDAIGIHAIFGGFLAGIIIPHEGGFAYKITQKIEDIVSVVFLPLYFALSGLKTQIGSINDVVGWGMVLLVIFAACFGKIIGCAAAARMTKMSWRESFTVGILMNCKGLVELIVLNLGYDAKVISEKTFTIMVIMALFTTFLTSPIVSWIYPSKYHNSSSSRKKSNDDGPKILVSVNKLEHVSPTLSLIYLLESKYNKRSGILDTNIDIDKLDINFSKTNNFLTKLRPNILARKNSNSSNVVVYALRLIEVTERDSCVMLQTSQDTLKDDPIMKTIQTFREIIKSIDIRGLVKVVTMSKFAEALTNTAVEVNSEFIVVPWIGLGSMVEEAMSPPGQAVYQKKFTRSQSLYTPPHHAHFIQDLLANNSSTASILVLVNRGLEISSLYSMKLIQVYLPFFGGPDDRKALEIAMAMAGKQGVEVKVVRFQNSQMDFSQSSQRRESDVESGVGSEDLIISTGHSPEFITSELEDNEILNKYFEIGTEIRHSRSANVKFWKVPTSTPVSTAVKWVKDLQCTDLVITGRRPSISTRGLFLSGANEERRSVLGDIVENIMLSECEASILVVQS